ncbi:hypothetical protein ANN_08648 [Periplaneta americana]|uniref:Tc1-like transposase DDE domain-containing protein n=1 Tax=Periplaneta americana TaxID=6978 RepID=A0ABQ8T3N3_PERAM|nr:hypothetical protein ANN_08648 [Periplaneta americana]
MVVRLEQRGERQVDTADLIGVSLGWRTELHIIDGALRGQRYAEEMVRECISNRRDAVGQENFIFLDDNARAHRAAVVMEVLEDLQINHLPLPPRSPDLNAIKHFWDLLQRKLDNHLPYTATIRELAEVLPIAFNEIPQD